MTNLITALVITVQTNWSGVGPEQREVGFIETNYTVQAVFENKTNSFLLEKRFSESVVWREKMAVLRMTNNYFMPSIIVTNPYRWHLPYNP